MILILLQKAEKSYGHGRFGRKWNLLYISLFNYTEKVSKFDARNVELIAGFVTDSKNDLLDSMYTHVYVCAGVFLCVYIYIYI